MKNKSGKGRFRKPIAPFLESFECEREQQEFQALSNSLELDEGSPGPRSTLPYGQAHGNR